MDEHTELYRQRTEKQLRLGICAVEPAFNGQQQVAPDANPVINRPPPTATNPKTSNEIIRSCIFSEQNERKSSEQHG